MNKATIIKILNSSINRLIEEQPELLDLEVTERALTHQLAKYVAEKIPNFDVDVEYNRHGNVPKRLNLPSRESSDDEIRARTVFPDIIVHRRNTDEENILVIEVKKPGEHLDYDNLKLNAFRKELGYLHTAHLILGLNTNDDLVKDLVWVDG